MTALTQTPAWQALVAHHAEIKDVHLRRLFADDPARAEHFSVEGAGLFLDYSKNRISGETMRAAAAAGRGTRGGAAARRDVLRREDQHHRTPRRAACRTARAARREDRGRRRRCRARGAQGARRDGGFRHAAAQRRFTGQPASASATWSISASAGRIWGRRWPIARCALSATGR